VHAAQPGWTAAAEVTVALAFGRWRRGRRALAADDVCAVRAAGFFRSGFAARKAAAALAHGVGEFAGRRGPDDGGIGGRFGAEGGAEVDGINEGDASEAPAFAFL